MLFVAIHSSFHFHFRRNFRKISKNLTFLEFFEKKFFQGGNKLYMGLVNHFSSFLTDFSHKRTVSVMFLTILSVLVFVFLVHWVILYKKKRGHNSTTIQDIVKRVAPIERTAFFLRIQLIFSILGLKNASRPLLEHHLVRTAFYPFQVGVGRIDVENAKMLV